MGPREVVTWMKIIFNQFWEGKLHGNMALPIKNK